MMQQLIADIEAAGGEDYIFARLASGDPVGRVAAEFGVSRPMLYKWRDYGSPEGRAERKRRWEQAIEDSADAKEEEGAEILDEVAERVVATPAQVQLATSRANYRRWQAEVRKPSKYGRKDQTVAVSVNVGSLHLDALRQRGSPHALAASQPEAIAAPVREAEVLSIEPAGDEDPLAELLEG